MGSIGQDGPLVIDAERSRPQELSSLKPIKKLSLPFDDDMANRKKYFLLRNTSIMEDPNENCLDLETTPKKKV